MSALTLYVDHYAGGGNPLGAAGYYSYNGGVTRRAVLLYVRYMADPILEPEPSRAQMRLVAEYCQYYICAPCWVFPAYELGMLRCSIEHVKLPHELASWLWGAAQIGVEPL